MRKLSIYKNKALVLKATEEDLNKARVATPNEIIELGVDKETGLGTVAVPWDFHNALRWKMFGLPSVSPIFRDRDWMTGPIHFRPYTHQITGINFLVLNRRCYLFAGTGTGKTAMAVWAAIYLYQLGIIKRILVLAPLSVIKDAWQKEPGQLLFGVMDWCVVYDDYSKKKKKELVRNPAPFHITNYDTFKNLHAEFMANEYDLVILDESTTIKNRETDIFKCVYPAVKRAKYAWQMTGTPTAKGPMDAFGQICMFDGFGDLPPNKYWFEGLVTYKPNSEGFKRLPRKGWQEICHKYLQPSLRMETRDCIDLPDIVYVKRWIPLTKVQQASVLMLRRLEAVNLADREISGDNAAILLNKIVQIACGAVLDENGDVIELQPTKRLQEVENIVTEAEGKTIVFVPFRAATTLVAEYLRKKRYKVGIIHGGINATARQKIFDDFQRPGKDKLDVIVGIAAAFSHGVTLTEASEVVWYGPITSAEIYLQAIARMERNGQKRKMKVTEIWGDERERQLYDVIAGRVKGQLTLLDLCKTI